MLHKKLILSISIAVTLYCLTSFQIHKDPNEEIIGTWISEDDPTQKWVFNDFRKTCVWYSNGESIFSFKYSISNFSPQCGVSVKVDNHTMYLKLTEIVSDDEYCYLINNVNLHNNGYLSITYLVNNKHYLFKKLVDPMLD